MQAPVIKKTLSNSTKSEQIQKKSIDSNEVAKKIDKNVLKAKIFDSFFKNLFEKKGVRLLFFRNSPEKSTEEKKILRQALEPFVSSLLDNCNLENIPSEQVVEIVTQQLLAQKDLILKYFSSFYHKKKSFIKKIIKRHFLVVLLFFVNFLYTKKKGNSKKLLSRKSCEKACLDEIITKATMDSETLTSAELDLYDDQDVFKKNVEQDFCKIETTLENLQKNIKEVSESLEKKAEKSCVDNISEHAFSIHVQEINKIKEDILASKDEMNRAAVSELSRINQDLGSLKSKISELESKISKDCPRR